MQCANPLSLRKPHFDFVANKFVEELKVPCGHCINCRIAKSREWALRCCLELPYWNSQASFITLTYDDEKLPKGYLPVSLDKSHVQKFIKRLRKDMSLLPEFCDSNGIPNLKYFCSGEYGSKFLRPHFHLILFGVGLSDDFNPSLGCYYSQEHLVEDNWPYGNVYTGTVTYQSCRYVAEYVFKKYTGEKKVKEYDEVGLQCPFQLVSHGLGERFIQDYKDVLLKRGYISVQGKKYALPKYFAEKLKIYDRLGLTFIRSEHAQKDFDKFCSNLDSSFSDLSDLEIKMMKDRQDSSVSFWSNVVNEKKQILRGR